ncbi:MAG: hypothetical protein K9N46_06505 [Candidatus Marinimicrobia bacterium]|nr:hypothetical protein [Candidatus Neomarinimicrobiota bacterium]MCF7828630.1 hypothetical protein [Candidatus Neomarinimicrobiota bacterium]MCF7880371.1 hypothetical protein [Candidatus Neomarinimicrobiota bacterium]
MPKFVVYKGAYIYGTAKISFEDGYAFDFKEETEEFSEHYTGYDTIIQVLSNELLSAMENGI